MLQLTAPGGHKDILLHACCAPCSGAVLECLVQNGLRPVVFFSNSNIVPKEEYDLRLGELVRYCRSLGVPLVEDEYDHQAWLDFVLQRKESDPTGQLALANAPERGPRCLNCFKFRLMRAVRYASSHSIPVLTTTLASSRWKSLDQVDAAGTWATAGGFGMVPPEGSVLGAKRPGVSEGFSPQSLGGAGGLGMDPPEGPVLWWNQNWRRGGLQPRRSEIICEQGFYNQNFCGCEFSKRHDQD